MRLVALGSMNQEGPQLHLRCAVVYCRPSGRPAPPRHVVRRDSIACVGCLRTLLSLGLRKLEDELSVSRNIVVGRLDAASSEVLVTPIRQVYHC
jgi:hypothetical protein